MGDGENKPVIAIIGGTGDLGSGLAKKWAAAGYKVLIGSRSREKAEAMAQSIGHDAAGFSYADAARIADVVVVAVPYASHVETLHEIKPVLSGKILVDAVVPLVPPKVSVVQLPADGSAARQAKDIVGDEVRVVSAFHNVGAAKLHQGGRAECDVLVFGDDPDARSLVIGLAGEVATRGVDGGVLANSVAAEALTSILIGINRRYKVAGAGIRITGLD
ncbi:NADPH-dependent f420 reductase [Afipia carboxidovorans OM5]|uniref:Putative F420-dependent NADP reductase n=1 Tax=Afipia carboxidovorans (strain ATCC 49405 / DSM 1227 / KCTC 32145 / OM5) TaxID=504832 RepID=B6JBS0_AFIC5|nr:NADPH-dependent F420 reductase [Afipia carboxidovorans]ACI92136.1 NADPH-dependent f420 reductase [Afipia carboxidovorans OM5]AEI07648.1 putative F420-dependent NADP reductase [Afipia carboxidovorans OM5]